MDLNYLYTIDAQAAWNYEQSLKQPHKQQLHKQHKQSRSEYLAQSHKQRKEELHAEVAMRRNMLVSAVEARKKLDQQPMSLEISKQIFRNEKDQETARTRLYLAQDRLERFNSKSPLPRRRRGPTASEMREANSYIDELFEKAQLNIAIGKPQNLPSRPRYSIPHTIRE